MANGEKVFGVLVSVFCLAWARQGNVVPALLWTNTGSEFQPSLMGHTTGSNEFLTDYLQMATGKPGHTLIAFIQDKLSLEDITNNADVYNEQSQGAMFANLKHLVETHPSTHLPSVESPSIALTDLKKAFKGKVHELKAPYDVKHLNLDSKSPNLVIAHVSTRDNNFHDVDNLLGSATADAETLGIPYTILYTGEKPSQVEAEHVYMGRHLLEDSDNPKETFFNLSNCIYVYVKNIALVFRPAFNGSEESVFNLPAMQGGEHGNCGNQSGQLSVKYSGLPTGLKSFEMKFIFNTSRSQGWITQDLFISYKVENESQTDIPMHSKMITAPKGFSYHCSRMGNIYNSSKDNTTSASKFKVSLVFKDLQVQFQNIRNDKFGRPNDCEGFFSVPVLMGLVSGLILLAILSFGISMIVNISTMDRFDDPKGKPITVNIAD